MARLTGAGSTASSSCARRGRGRPPGARRPTTGDCLGRIDLAGLPRGGVRVAAARTSGPAANVVAVTCPPAAERRDHVGLDASTTSWGTRRRDMKLVAPVESARTRSRDAHPGLVDPGTGSSKRSGAGRPSIPAAQPRLYGSALIWESQVLAANADEAPTPATLAARRATATTSSTGTSAIRATDRWPMSWAARRAIGRRPRRSRADGRHRRLVRSATSTSWIVGHTDRIQGGVTCRSVNDIVGQMPLGDIGGTSALYGYGVPPVGRTSTSTSPLAADVREKVTTPALIQHAEGPALHDHPGGKELFAVLRSSKRAVRLMRVPDESHELTRPARRSDEWTTLRLIDESFPPLPGGWQDPGCHA